MCTENIMKQYELNSQCFHEYEICTKQHVWDIPGRFIPYVGLYGVGKYVLPEQF